MTTPTSTTTRAAPVITDASQLRPLPLTFSKNGFTYEQVLRDGRYAIYKQRLRPGEGCLAYEVFRVRIEPATTMFGQFIPLRESGPSNEDFGFRAWSYPDLAQAKAKLVELRKGRKKSGDDE